jgi:hypothetical protein
MTLTENITTNLLCLSQVQVWWVDNHVSMCWPQDLYRVGEYDSDEGELWDTPASDASWETESEDCYIADVRYVLLFHQI